MNTPVSEQELKEHQANIGGKRVTLDALKANIEKVDHYVHPDSQLTVCIITLKNGFTVTGESACADPVMFNAEIGRRVSQDNAEKKIWPLMGYNLKQELYLSGGTTPTTFKERVVAESKDLKDKIVKLQAFIEGNEQFKRLSDDDQKILNMQHMIMKQYEDIINLRINRLE